MKPETRSQTARRNSTEPGRHDLWPRCDARSAEPFRSGRRSRLLVEGRRGNHRTKVDGEIGHEFSTCRRFVYSRLRPNRKTQRLRRPESTAFSFRSGSSPRMSNPGDPNRSSRSRMLVHRKALTRGKFIDRNRKKRAVVPVRFVRACRCGHIGDIDWYSFVHGGTNDCSTQASPIVDRRTRDQRRPDRSVDSLRMR